MTPLNEIFSLMERIDPQYRAYRKTHVILEDARGKAAKKKCLDTIRQFFNNAAWLDNEFVHQDNPNHLTTIDYILEHFLEEYYHDRDIKAGQTMRLAPMFLKAALDNGFQQQNPDHQALNKISRMVRLVHNMGQEGKLDIAKIPLNTTWRELDEKFGTILDKEDSEQEERINSKEYHANTEYKIVGPLSFEESKQYGDKSSSRGKICYTQGLPTYDSYTHDGQYKLFVLLKNGWENIPEQHDSTSQNAYDTYGMSMIFVIVDPYSGKLIKSNTRWNHNADYPGHSVDNAFNEEELSELLGANFKQLFLDKCHTKLDIIEQIDQYTAKAKKETGELCLINTTTSELLAGPSDKLSATAFEGEVRAFWPKDYDTYNAIRIKRGQEESTARLGLQDAVNAGLDIYDIIEQKIFDGRNFMVGILNERFMTIFDKNTKACNTIITYGTTDIKTIKDGVLIFKLENKKDRIIQVTDNGIEESKMDAQTVWDFNAFDVKKTFSSKEGGFVIHHTNTFAKIAASKKTGELIGEVFIDCLPSNNLICMSKTWFVTQKLEASVYNTEGECILKGINRVEDFLEDEGVMIVRGTKNMLMWVCDLDGNQISDIFSNIYKWGNGRMVVSDIHSSLAITDYEGNLITDLEKETRDLFAGDYEVENVSIKEVIKNSDLFIICADTGNNSYDVMANISADKPLLGILNYSTENGYNISRRDGDYTIDQYGNVIDEI